RPVEGTPALENLRLVFLGDLDALGAGNAEEDLLSRVEHRGGERPVARRLERSACREPNGRDLRRRRRLGSELLGERVELQLDEKVAKPAGVGSGPLERGRLEGDGEVRRDRDEGLREDRRLLVLAEALSDLSLDLVRLRQERVEVPVG